MVDLNLMLPQSFFLEEERSGYLVSSKMKQVWAVELDLLNEFVNFCDHHGLTYFAMGGTLLGGVRHKGFIPWDDDIDILMPRNDYEKFRFLSCEFSYPYHFQDEYSEPGVLYGHAKLRNSDTTAISEPYLGVEHGNLSFNMGIFIDVFPLDNMPDELSERELWFSELKQVAANAWKLRKYSHRGIPQHDKLMDEELDRLNSIGRPNYWFEEYDRILSRYKDVKTDHNTIYCLSRSTQKRWEYFNSDFNESMDLPFEMLRVKVPKNYDNILTKCYGDWRVEKRVPSLHSSVGGSYFDTDKSYRNFLDNNGCLNRELVINLMANRNN